jgi:hypothetical protein
MIPTLNKVKKGGGFSFNFISKDGKINKKKWIKFVDNVKNFNVSYGGPEGIKINKDFFNYFKEKEQVALLWHEYHHARKKVFTFGRNCEEFRADKYSALKNSIEDCLSYLKIGEKLYDEKIIPYDPKKHPPIKKRIERIEKLRVK